ncbi:MAG: GIY-YIG nuclease family protein [Anaerolineae bacterium]|nr:GIY-YIG nuclease family protein [Anaerolineae bacterium]
MNGAIWPAASGTYALLIDVTEPLALTVGKLGFVKLPPGAYVYLGSAHGPGGLNGRLARHMRLERRRHWHIDYLTEITPTPYVYFEIDVRRLECRWAQRVLDLDGATAPVPGFGNSDCRNSCLAHLVRLPDSFRFDQLAAILNDA